jgi:Protein of unknown function (DUF1579)
MKTRIRLASLLAATLSVAAHAQAPSSGCTSAESRRLDFWLGNWELTHSGGKSTNRVSKVLGGCVVLEEFRGMPGTNLDGMSVSTFDPATRSWRQTWVDNTGAYLDFNAVTADGNLAFERTAQKDGKRIRQRMVFRDVKADSFTWDWQRSDDDGANWKTTWQIAYKRAP